MSIPKRQHWVPRFYLRYFKVPNRDNTIEQVWILNRKRSEPRLTAIENIAVQKYLYTPKSQNNARDPRLEKKLSDLENDLSRIWRKLATDFVDLGSDGIRKGIGLFLAVQFLRHPERLKSIINFRRSLCEQHYLDNDYAGDVTTIQIGSRVYPLNNSTKPILLSAGPELDERLWLRAYPNNP